MWSLNICVNWLLYLYHWPASTSSDARCPYCFQLVCLEASHHSPTSPMLRSNAFVTLWKRFLIKLRNIVFISTIDKHFAVYFSLPFYVFPSSNGNSIGSFRRFPRDKHELYKLFCNFICHCILMFLAVRLRLFRLVVRWKFVQ